MKLLHLADLHLGKNVNGFSMIADQAYILEEILTLAEQKKADGVLLAGDIYDRSVPSEEAVALFDSFLTKLAGLKKQVFVISGNHDSEERLQFGSSLFRAKGIYIAGKYEGTLTCIDIADEYGPFHIWLLPYVRVSQVAHYFPEKIIKTYEEAVQVALEASSLNVSERNVLLLHQFVTGSSRSDAERLALANSGFGAMIRKPELAGSEGFGVSVGTIEQISAACFAAFDYVAMGHIHSPQAVGRETCRYAGSPLKYSLQEREIHQEKTVPLVTFCEKGSMTVELLPLKPRREVRRLRGTLRQLLEHAPGNGTSLDSGGTEDYIYATLTDETVQFEAMARLQEVYPYTMKLDYDNQETRGLQEWDGRIETEGKGFAELIEEFYALIYGGKPTEADWKLLEDVAREAGVIG